MFLILNNVGAIFHNIYVLFGLSWTHHRSKHFSYTQIIMESMYNNIVFNIMSLVYYRHVRCRNQKPSCLKQPTFNPAVIHDE